MKAMRNVGPLFVIVLSLSLVGVFRPASATDREQQLDRVEEAVLYLEYLGVDGPSRTRYLSDVLTAILQAGFSGGTLNLVADTLRVVDQVSGREINTVIHVVRQELQEARERMRPSEVPTIVQNGDTDGNGDIDITDAIRLVEFLFLGGEEPVPAGCNVPVSAPQDSYSPRLQNGDTNGDGTRDISDFVRLLGWQFLGDEAPVQNVCAAVSS